MAKIMLVEDDNNLREIYEARLLAEGYEIVSAEDGEQALALAVKEKPDLIISDVMMPKISGFDMLDILRSTPETRSTKVIMMTALSQAEDKARASKLGADRYLVKSQVTLEDVAKVAHEVLTGEVKAPEITATDTSSATPPAEAGAASGPAPDPTPITPTPTPTPTPDPTAAPEPAQSPVAPDPAATPTPNPSATPVSEPPQTQTAGDPGGSSQTDAPKADPAPVAEVPGTQTSANETANVEDQINNFVQSMPTPTATPDQTPPAPMTDPAQTAQNLQVARPPASDATNAAADTAADMANAVNDLLQKPEAQKPAESDLPKAAAPRSNNQIAGKKVISPINDLSAPSGPTLNELLAKEMGTSAATTPAPEVPAPNDAVTPTATPDAPKEEQPVEIKTPGNVLQPGGQDDPNNIAL